MTIHYMATGMSLTPCRLNIASDTFRWTREEREGVKMARPLPVPPGETPCPDCRTLNGTWRSRCRNKKCRRKLEPSISQLPIVHP